MKLQYDTVAGVLTIHDRVGRIEVRGAPAYEGAGYDPADPVAVVLDGLGRRAVDFSALMTGAIVPVRQDVPGAEVLVAVTSTF